MILNKPKIVSFTALKGGTGKTIVTFNIVSLLATEYNKKVLVIDVDAQHNMSNLLYKPIKKRYSNVKSERYTNEKYEFTTEDIFEFDTPSKNVIKNSHIRNLDIIPTTINLTAIELQISGIAGRELILRNWLYDNQHKLAYYDYIFFDTNPTMSIINTNAFICCDSIILTCDIDLDSIFSVETFMKLLYPILNRINREMEDNIKGLLINRVKDNTLLCKDFMAFLKSDDFMFADILLESVIHNATAIAETKAYKTHVSCERNERSYQEFNNVIKELIAREVL